MTQPIVQSVAKQNIMSKAIYILPNVFQESVTDLDLLKTIPLNNHSMLPFASAFKLLVLQVNKFSLESASF